MFQCQVVRSRSNSCLETWTARWQEESLCLSSSCCSLRFCFCYFGPSIGDACRTLRIAPPSPSENNPMWYEVKPLTHLRGCLNFTHQPDREHEGLMWCNSSSTHPPFMELVLKPMTAASLTRFIKPQVRNLWIVFCLKFHEEINAVFILLNRLKHEAMSQTEMLNCCLERFCSITYSDCCFWGLFRSQVQMIKSVVSQILNWVMCVISLQRLLWFHMVSYSECDVASCGFSTRVMWWTVDPEVLKHSFHWCHDFTI